MSVQTKHITVHGIIAPHPWTASSRPVGWGCLLQHAQTHGVPPDRVPELHPLLRSGAVEQSRWHKGHMESAT